MFMYKIMYTHLDHVYLQSFLGLKEQLCFPLYHSICNLTSNPNPNNPWFHEYKASYF